MNVTKKLKKIVACLGICFMLFETSKVAMIAKAYEANTYDIKTYGTKTDDVKTDDAKTDDGKTDDGKTDDTKTGETARDNNSPKKTDLPLDQTSANNVSALGFPDGQQTRTDVSGQVIDKNKSNPLGSSMVNFNRTLQLAIAGVGKTQNYGVYENPIGTTTINFNQLLKGYPSNDSSEWIVAKKTMVAADITGTGKQAVVTCALVPISGISIENYYKLVITTTDYSESNPMQQYETIVPSIPALLDYGNTEYPIRSAAGDFNEDGIDEVAIVVARTLYLCQYMDMSWKLISSVTFDENSKIAQIPNSKEDRPAMEVCAGDSDKDGFDELLVTTGSSYGGKTHTPRLLLYDGMDVNNPTVNIPLKINMEDSNLFQSPSVDVGDIFGTGEEVIVIGGRTTKGKVCLTYLTYRPEEEEKEKRYDTILSNEIFELDVQTFKAVDSALFGLKCVSLTTLRGGEPKFIVFGSFIYRFNKESKSLDSYPVDSFTNDSKLKGNNTKKSKGGITNTNTKEDSTYIMDTLVGNFDGNGEGKEQIIMLHYNSWYKNDYVYITWCDMNSDGNLSAHLTQVWKSKSKQEYTYPSICAPDTFCNGLRLEYVPEKTVYTFSDPMVLAVLAASPYYEELEEYYKQEGETTYGSESEESTSQSNGANVSVGMSFGYSKDFGILGITIGSVSFETEIENSLTNTWTTGKSITKGVSFTNRSGEDAVVVLVVPYDIYYYKVYQANGEITEMTIEIPYSPITKIMPVTEYNGVAKNINNAPLIDEGVLRHKVGDPRSYPQSVNGLSNLSDKSVLTGSSSVKGKNQDFISAGLGDTTTEQSITTSNTSESSFQYEQNIKVTFNTEWFGATFGTSMGSGYSRQVTASSTKTTTRAGKVAGLPIEYKRYEFLWNLVTYNYNLQAGDSSQQCTVISYLVKPIKEEFPPAVPTNFAGKADVNNLTGATLSWDKVKDAAGYVLTRSRIKEGVYEDVAKLKGVNNCHYTDTDISYGETYYYKVHAYSIDEGVPTKAINIPMNTVMAISIKQQPKLYYQEGDRLDLSSLMITFIMSDKSTRDIPYAEFAENNITVDQQDKMELKATDTGTVLKVNFVPGGISVNLNQLIVSAEKDYDFILSVKFQIGDEKDATTLIGNEMLDAKISIQNTLNRSEQIIVILTLYDDTGSMVKMSYVTQELQVGENKTIHQGFRLPPNVANYTVKVFALDGSDLASSNLIPVSNTIQIP